MIDPNIIMRGAEQAQAQQQQNIDALGKLGGAFGRLFFDNKVNQMRNIDDEAERKAFANNSIFAPYLNATLKSDIAEKAKMALDAQKTQSEVAKNLGAAGKDYADAGNTNQKTGAARIAASMPIFQHLASTGDLVQAGRMIDMFEKNGTLDPATAQSYRDQATGLTGQTPEQIKSYGLQLVKASLDPKYTYQDANNVADNATSIANNKLNNQTSRLNNAENNTTTRRGQDINYQSDQEQRAQQQSQFTKNFEYNAQQDEIKNGQGEIKEFGGKAYIVYKNGQFKPAVGEDGKQIESVKGSGTMNATTQKELFETQDAITAGNTVITGLQDALKLNDDSYSGATAGSRAAVGGFAFSSGDIANKSTNTKMIDNIVTGNALSALKATFGGAPTEGERKILLELQGSVNLPAEQRKAIWERAIKMAQIRVESNQQKAEGLRNGSYFKPQQGQPSPATNTPTPATSGQSIGVLRPEYQSQPPNNGKATNAIQSASKKYGI